MSPITHFLVSWVGLERFLTHQRDKALVVAAGLIPDVDGLGIVVDFANRLAGWAETNYYQSFHRMYGHGLPAALLIVVLAALLGVRKSSVALWALVSFHLHLLCDLIGARGSTPEDLWGIYYLGPLVTTHELRWAGQWPLVGWQNTLITVVLLSLLMVRAANLGYSPVGWLSQRMDQEFIATLRQWKTRLLGALNEQR